MCSAQIYKSQTCAHRWVVLTTPCAPDKNISNCTSFQDGRTRHLSGLRHILAPPKACPQCDMKNLYDGSHLRMIKDFKVGVKCGAGPSKSDQGREFTICTIM
ncbi:hypothetical protein MMC07_008950 [Pseudocyphellaria aurata]|nr:hypothetical protein [Pseudocyphellaria aurata]